MLNTILYVIADLQDSNETADAESIDSSHYYTANNSPVQGYYNLILI